MMRSWQIWVGLGISAFFLWLALRGLDLGAVGREVGSAQFFWLVPSVLVYFVGVYIRTWRWDYMLRPLKHIPVSRLFPVVVIGYMGNNVYPFRAGEILRSYVLFRREDVPVSASLATVIVERVFDGLVMLLFVFVALPFAPLPANAQWVRTTVNLASIGFFAAMAVFFFLAARPAFALDLVTKMTTPLPDGFQMRLLDFAERFLGGLESLRNFRNVIMIFVTSIIIWLLETAKYWFVMQAFDFNVPFFVLMLMNGIVNLATTLPSSPGYVGTFDTPGIATLTLYGVQQSVATAYTLVLHAALWLPITVLGFYFMIREGYSWGELGRAMKTEGNPT